MRSYLENKFVPINRIKFIKTLTTTALQVFLNKKQST